MASFGKKTRNPGWKSGDHWVECERTGKIIRASDAREEWTGLIVAKEEWEPRHPQDMLRPRADHTAAQGLVRPETLNIGVGPDTGAIAGVAIAGQAVAGRDSGYDISNDTTIPGGTFDTNNETL